MARTKPKERERDRVLSDDELRALWAALDDRDTAVAKLAQRPGDHREVFGSLVRTLLLSAQRREEVAHMARSEVATDGVWIVPAERNKTKKAKAVPLGSSALNIIRAQAQIDGADLVFTTNGTTAFSGFSKCKRALDAAMLEKLLAHAAKHGDHAALGRLHKLSALLKRALAGDTAAAKSFHRAWWTLHDLRRTAKTLMARAGVRPDISERVLGHMLTGVEGVYDRHGYTEEKRAALEALEAWVARIVAEESNGIPLSRTAAKPLTVSPR